MTDKNALPTILKTKRLTLRAPALSDVADLVVMANNANIFTTTATLPFPYTEAHAEGFVANAATNPDVKAYAIAGPDDRLMGVISLMRLTDTTPELGYWLGEPHWSRGYVTESATALLAAVRNIPKFAVVDAKVLETNLGSVRVLEKAGFVIVERSTGTMERHQGKLILIMQWSAP